MSGVRSSWRTRRTGWTVLVVAVGLLGLLVRLEQLRRSGPLSLGAYDDDVHFTAAVDLVHGRLPYRDVLFLQPPGILLAASPFAVLAEGIGDARAFGGARIAFSAIGGLNAALVALLLRRFGVPAALVGGVLYAVSFPAVYVERTLTLEPLGTTGMLLGLLLLLRARDLGSGAGFVLAGLAAGATIGFKIWCIVPFAVLLLWARGGRLRFLLGGVLAGLAIYGPFFVAAPARMWQQVVLAQLGRPDASSPGLVRRVRSILGVSGGSSPSPLPHVPPGLLTGVLATLAIVLTLIALLDRRAHVFVALLVAVLAVLLLSPSYFQHYSILTVAPLALVAGAATQRVVAALPGRWPAMAVVALVLVAVVALNVRHDLQRQGHRPPVAALRAAVAEVRGCIVADDPGFLIITNRLTPEVADGCDIQADPSGAGYVVPSPAGTNLERIDKPGFQRAILAYLHSGSAYVWLRGGGLQLSPASVAVVQRDRVLFERGRFVLRAAPGH